MTTGLIKIKKITLWYETFGNPANTSILLLMGAGAQGVSWPTHFCEKLAENYHVIRYDNRDTGLSSSIDFTSTPYSLPDMAEDAMMIVAELGINKVHMIGTSMGGFLTILLAAKYPKMITSITLISTTYDIGAIIKDRSEYQSPLPESNKDAKDFLSTIPNKETDPAEHHIQYLKILNGNENSFDWDFFRKQVTSLSDRSKQPNNNNHALAMQNTERLNIEHLLPKISCPTLILHGHDDPLIPIKHGITLAEKIHNAQFLGIKDMGHILDGHFDAFIDNIQEHLNGAEEKTLSHTI